MYIPVQAENEGRRSSWSRRRYGTVRVELDQVNNARGIPPKTVQLERSPNTVTARAYDREDVSYPPSRDP
jgi:hypothetical protein